jgi:hypothetical protein
MMDFMDAFDQAVFMKVLPKFTGSLARLRSPLLDVLTWAFYPANPVPMRKSVADSFRAFALDDHADIAGFVVDAAFPVVAGRVTQMLRTLETDGFVSSG